MIMDVYLHTVLAIGAIGSAYYAGHYFTKANIEEAHWFYA